MEYMTPFAADVFGLTFCFVFVGICFYVGATWDEKR